MTETNTDAPVAKRVRTMFERMEDTIAQGIADDLPTHAIVHNVLQHLVNAPENVIDQGCVALRDKHYQLQEAKWSGNQLALPKLKMKLRWRAMIKAIMKGM